MDTWKLVSRPRTSTALTQQLPPPHLRWTHGQRKKRARMTSSPRRAVGSWMLRERNNLGPYQTKLQARKTRNLALMQHQVSAKMSYGFGIRLLLATTSPQARLTLLCRYVQSHQIAAFYNPTPDTNSF